MFTKNDNEDADKFIQKIEEIINVDLESFIDIIFKIGGFKRKENNKSYDALYMLDRKKDRTRFLYVEEKYPDKKRHLSEADIEVKMLIAENLLSLMKNLEKNLPGAIKKIENNVNNLKNETVKKLFNATKKHAEKINSMSEEELNNFIAERIVGNGPPEINILENGLSDRELRFVLSDEE